MSTTPSQFENWLDVEVPQHRSATPEVRYSESGKH